MPSLFEVGLAHGRYQMNMHTWFLHGERRRGSFKCGNKLKKREVRPVAIGITKQD